MTDYSYIVTQQIESGDVVKYDKERFNSNNHWKDDQMPDDYCEVLNMTNTKSWIDLFRSNYKIIELDYGDVLWMKKAFAIGKTTGKFSKCYYDELEQTLEKYKPITDVIFADGNPGYFIRTENVSLKHGCHGVGPYTNFKDVLESTCSCIHGHTPVDEFTKELKFYILPWIEMSSDKEFRVFVCNKQITAISTQSCYQINKTLRDIESPGQREETICHWVHTIVTYLDSVKGSIPAESFSVDISLVETRGVDQKADDPLSPYLIELNCFGKEYAAGSSLFHWLLDEDILYDRKGEGKVYFRYIIS
jgi:hypothetical protein